LDVKTKPTEELTEAVEVIEEIDEEEQIQDEVGRPFPPCDSATQLENSSNALTPKL